MMNTNSSEEMCTCGLKILKNRLIEHINIHQIGDEK